MSIEILIAVLATLLIFATATERLIEIAKPLFLYVKDYNWQKALKVLASVLVNFGLSALFQYSILKELGIEVAPVLGFLASGLVASVGSSILHPLLEWLKGLDGRR